MNEQEVGIGPHPLPWPDGEQYDHELLANGDRRNVEDRYRYLSVEAIKADLDMTRHDIHVAIENWQHDMNIGTIVRNANAFNVAAVHIIGKRQWNKRGAMVTDRYLNVFHHSTVAEFVVAIGDRKIIAVDNQEGAVMMPDAELPAHAVLVFGGEGPGLSAELVSVSQVMIAIPQFGGDKQLRAR